MNGRRFAPILSFVALIAGAVAWVIFQPRETTRAPDPPSIAIGGRTMGGDWSLTLRHLPASQTPEALQTACQATLDRLENEMSTYCPTSDLSRFNRMHDTDWFEVPQDLANVVWTAQRVSEETGGAFDVTVAPLVDLWGFGPEPTGLRIGNIPTDDAITAARQHVGYQHLHVRLAPPALRKDDADVHIDLSAIAKGYAAGRIASALDAQGVTDYLITIGGEVRAKGVSNLGRPWRVGIEVPTPDTRRILRQIELRDASVSTSGDYRNFFDVAGQRFSHEIDPRTGRPAANAPASVSVIHPDPAYADAMATALMVLGPIEGEALARRLKLPALFVTRSQAGFEVRATPEFERMIVDAPTTSPSRL
ncbi:MAG: rane-associated lipoprotein involved in thiamine biosynthesis [Phycisphaerales bacterium]|nr:rane-associated lipoprotein involved in thiamine biosynthesis [Phycisphaerales bacterium]